MIFIHPMWDSENERLGMKACTPLGYKLREIGDLVGFIGLFLFFGVIIYSVLARQPTTRHGWWLVAVPIAFGIVGRILYTFGWLLAKKKKFHYDDSRTVTWFESGQRMQYPPLKASSTPILK
jgi:hypothetical protein